VARERSWTIAALLLAALFAGNCSNCARDLDGTPQGANALPLDSDRVDNLNCGHDCTDWYRTTVSGSGTLEVRVTSRPATGTPPRFYLELYRSDMRGLDSRMGEPAGSARVRGQVGPGSYLSRVRVESGAMNYEIRASMLRPPRPEKRVEPPRPVYRTISARIIEIEGRSERDQRVLIDQGETAGLRRGQKGRLVDKGRTLAELEIVEVFAEGSRARVIGRMKGVVSGETRAEIQVPVN
jgi:hypothetical protein